MIGRADIPRTSGGPACPGTSWSPPEAALLRFSPPTTARMPAPPPSPGCSPPFLRHPHARHFVAEMNRLVGNRLRDSYFSWSASQ